MALWQRGRQPGPTHADPAEPMNGVIRIHRAPGHGGQRHVADHVRPLADGNREMSRPVPAKQFPSSQW